MADQLTGPQLPAVGLVADLSREDRDTLSSYGEFHLANPEDVLITQGQSHGKLLFILSGLLHAVRRETGREVLLGPIHQGEWVGEVDLFDPGSAVCSVVVIESVQYWAITRADFEQFLNNYPEAGIQLVIGVASTLGRRLRGVTKKLMDEAQMAAVRAALLTGSE
ncbi:MAG: Crp/Fnr family transcriptional regulator [Terrimicrobiaceae bacterium]